MFLRQKAASLVKPVICTDVNVSMSIKYGQIEQETKRKRFRNITAQAQEAAEDKADLSPEWLERRLLTLARQNKAPSVAKAATAELLERKAPRVKNPEQGLSANEARKLADIYERLFTPTSTERVRA